jgi:mRNA interferase RelE/StbE
VTYRVLLAPSAARELRKFDPDVRRRIQAALDLLATEPRPPAATRLVGGSGEWRVRTGDNRIVYEINDDQLLVLVLRTAHRARSTTGENGPMPPRPLKSEVPVPRFASTAAGSKSTAGVALIPLGCKPLARERSGSK